MRRMFLFSIALVVAISSQAHAQWTSGRPDGHAPIGVMQDHRHEQGEIMLSYRFMYMDMDGSRVDTDPVSDQAVIDPNGFGFQVTPTVMPMQMQMFGVMWAPSDAITLVGMLPLTFKDMDHITRMAGTRENPAFTTESGGIGDLVLSGMVKLYDWGRQATHLNLGVSLPTGSVEERDVTPASMGMEVQLPYPMQIGSGTFDLLPGVTYLGQIDAWSWGGQVMGVIRLGDNDRDWTLGNAVMGTAWGARRINSNLSASLRGVISGWGDVDGRDSAPSVDPAVVPTARTDLRYGTRADVGLGLNVSFPRAKGLRFAGELLLPFYQDLNGPQLETDWQVVVGAQLVAVQR